MEPQPSAQPPLHGVVVVDLTRLLPGPLATQILVDLGATVIKVEDNQGGDYARYFPPLCEDGTASSFHALNRGKLSVMLNLKDAKGRESLLQLLETADVLIESFRPGTLARLGLHPTDVLLKRFPSLVVCSISGYGQTGPDSLRAGHDVNYLARAGVLGMMHNPVVLPVQVADIAAGTLPAVIQILAGLRRAEATGVGSFVDVSMTDSAYSLLAMPLSRYAMTGEEVGDGKDLLSGSMPCYRVYETADGHISVGALEPKFWIPLVTALGMEELIPLQLAKGPDGEAVIDKLSQAFRSKSNAQWAAFFKDLDCCVEVIDRPEGISERDPQLRHRKLDIPLEIKPPASAPPGSRPTILRVPRTMINMTGAEPSRIPAPALGEHTEQVLNQLRSRL